MSFSTVEDLALISKNFIGMSTIFVIQMHMPYLGNRMELWPEWKSLYHTEKYFGHHLECLGSSHVKVLLPLQSGFIHLLFIYVYIPLSYSRKDFNWPIHVKTFRIPKYLECFCRSRARLSQWIDLKHGSPLTQTWTQLWYCSCGFFL